MQGLETKLSNTSLVARGSTLVLAVSAYIWLLCSMYICDFEVGVMRNDAINVIV